MDPAGPPKRQHGCLFFGCISGAVCLLLLLLGFLLAFKMTRNALTSARPMDMPTLQLSQPEIEEVERRFNNFSDAVSAGRPARPLELSSDDINALIQNSPDFRNSKSKIYVTVEGTNLQAQVSVPMEQLGLKLFKGRYLNGTGTFAVRLQNGLLDVTTARFRVKNRPLPGVLSFKVANYARDAVNNNSRASVALNRLQSIELKDGKLIFVPKVER